MSTQRIIVSNAKGGCGKTTLATNIASYYAQKGKVVRLFDHDMQGSSLHWVRRRSENATKIHGIDASLRAGNNMTRSWQLRVPVDTDVVIVDTPAGIDAPELANMFNENDFLVIPVLPSPIDIHATAYFIKDILLIGKARTKQVKIAVVANRTRTNTLMYHSLERFLFNLNLPFITTLRDTQFYSKAFESGQGILDFNHPNTRKDHEQWAPLTRWLDTPVVKTEAQVRPLFNTDSASS